MTIEDWGWSADCAEEAAGLLPAGWQVGRIVGRGKDLYHLTDGRSACPAAVSGSFRYRAVLPSDYPVTGDFVAFREEADTRVIERVLPRRGVVSRKAAGAREEEQLLAANVDTVFLVFALDGGRGFLPRLVERLLALVRDGGAAPAVLLNKADLVGEGGAKARSAYRAEAEAAAPGADVLFTSARTGESLERLRERLVAGRTFLFLGKSGVGKSSLINALFGADLLPTAEVRESDGRGRHTTTSRDLFRLPNGALLLDGPGLREAALWAAEASVDEVFPEIAARAAECRFRDCRHAGEPGCAVQQDLLEGTLDPGRYESWLDYQREAAYHRRLGDEHARRQERARWKKIGKMQKDLYRDREHR